MKKENVKIVATNRKARHEYFIEETIEAGLVLKGTEVKSVRQGKINVKESYAVVENGEDYVYNMHISPYEQGNIYNVDPIRKRKLLLHKREIRKLDSFIMQKGYTLIPLTVYIKDGLVKDKSGTIAGSSITMAKGVLNMINSGFNPITVLKSATSIPARLMNLKNRGLLKNGYYADVNILDSNFKYLFTISRGIRVN